MSVKIIALNEPIEEVWGDAGKKHEPFKKALP
jgi:hypothetical protein